MENPQSLENVAENWYTRLNRLKKRFRDPALTEAQREKCIRLIAVMLGRMMGVSKQYVEVKTKSSIPRFASGGIISGSQQEQPFPPLPE